MTPAAGACGRASRLALALLFVALPVLVVSGGPAAGAPDDSGPARAPGDRMTVTSQTSWVPAAGTFEVNLNVATPDPSEVRLQMTVFDRLQTRSDFAASLSDHIHTRPIERFDPVELSSVGPSPRLTVPINQAPTATGPPPLRLHDAGVYPVEIDLYDPNGRLLDWLVTHLLYTGSGSASSTKLDVAWVLALHAPPTTRSGGSPSGLPPATAQSLAQLADVLSSHPGAPVTLAITPETLEALQATAGFKKVPSQLGQAAAAEVVGTPYVRLDVPALLSAGLGGEIGAQLSEGEAVLKSLLGAAPTAGTWVASGPLSPASVDALAARRVTGLVVQENSLNPLPASQRNLTLGQPFSVAGHSGRPVPAVAADPGLTGHFLTGADQVLGAHELLADLAMIQQEVPDPSHGRGVVVLAPDGWLPGRAFVSTVLDGLTTSPTLAPVSVARLFSDVAPLQVRGSPLVRTVGPQQPGQPISDGPAILAARRQATGLSAVQPANSALSGQINQALLLSESADLADRLRPGLVDTAVGLIEHAKQVVRLPGNRSITLTARQGRIPITILSNVAYPVRVRMVLSSPRLGFRPIGLPGANCTRSGIAEACMVSLRNQNTTITVPVEAKTVGVFSLTVDLESPDGGLVLASGVDTVRSTAASGVGIILSVGAALLLAVWWMRDLRHGRRARQLVPAPGGSGPDGSTRDDRADDSGGRAVSGRRRDRYGGPGSPGVGATGQDPEPGSDEWLAAALGLDVEALRPPPRHSGPARRTDRRPQPYARPAPVARQAPHPDSPSPVEPPPGRSPMAGPPRAGPPLVERPPVQQPLVERPPVQQPPVSPAEAVTQPVPAVTDWFAPPSQQAPEPPPRAGPPAGTDPGGNGLGGGFSRNAGVMAAGTLLSRLTGFVRVVAVVWAFHVSGRSAPVADAYNLANTVPNILFDLVLGGVLSATLIPVFVDYMSRDDPDESWRAISAVVTAITVTLAVLTAVFYLVAPLIIRFYMLLNNTPGAADQRAVGTTLLRMFVPQLFLLGGIAVTTALLNARRRFGAPAFSPVLNNLITIAAIVGTRLVASDLSITGMRHEQTALLLLGLGTTSGYLVQFLVQLPAMRGHGMRLRPVWDLRHPAVRTVLRLSTWTFGAVLANQVAFTLVLVLADRKTGDVTVFQTAYQFFQLPYAIFAVSIASVITPDLAERWSARDAAGFARQMAGGLRLTMAILVPAAVGYVALAHPFLELLFHHGTFSAGDAHRIGTVVGLFAIGLPGFSAYLLLMRAYQAMQDTRAMFWLYVLENAATLVLAGALYPSLGVGGLALGWAGAYTIGAIAAFAHLRSRTGSLEGRTLAAGLVRIAAASAIMVLPVLALSHLIGGGSDARLAVEVVGGAILGGAVYLASAQVFGIEDINALLHLGVRRTAG